jgi:hypothetical protein
MILHGKKKNLLKNLVRYYVETTDNTYDEFILGIQKSQGLVGNTTRYADWLAVKCFEIFEKQGITLLDCVENKDVIHASINADKSRNEGEFYTPMCWCEEGRRYLKAMLGDLYGKAYIYDNSAGTGNLMKTSSYPKDKLFMSTLLAEDVTFLKGAFPNVPEDNIFQCDFVNGIDWDGYNMHFSEQLPPKLREVLENNEPLVFYNNPPYKVMSSTSSDVGEYMTAVGLGKCAADIFHQFIYRILMLKRFYKLTNVYLGIFGPLTMFHSYMLKDLFNQFKEEFIFEDGMCFDAADFSNTSESVGWVVGYTCWRSKTEEEKETGAEKPVLLTAKRLDADNNLIVIGKKLVRNVETNLHDWTMPSSEALYGQVKVSKPLITSMFGWTKDVVDTTSNTLGYLMSSNYVIRATRRSGCTSLPIPDGIPIVEENFWRCVASFASRRSYMADSNPFNSCQYTNMPDTSIEGYKEWLSSGLALLLFDYGSLFASYRDLEVEGEFYGSCYNALFPISREKIKGIVTDEAILQDIASTPLDSNDFIVKTMDEVYDLMYDEAKELCNFAANCISDSLQGTKRKELGYTHHTLAWDASLVQLRTVPELWSEAKEKEFMYLVAKLKNRLFEGVYKYGFIMDTMESDGIYEEEMTELSE